MVGTRLGKWFIAVVVLAAVSWAGALTASGRGGSSRPHPPSAREAQALRQAEARRRHPKGTKILAMRVAGPHDRYGAVIFRQPNAEELAARSTAHAAAGKIISFPGAGTDYYDNNRPSKPNKALRPHYYDIHVVAEGHGTGHYNLPQVNDSDGGCVSASIDYRAKSDESFSADARHVRIPSSRESDVASQATYKGTNGETDTTGPCGNSPANITSCSNIEGLNPKGAKEPDSIIVEGYRISGTPIGVFDANVTFSETGSCAGPYSNLAGAFLGGNATLGADGVANGYGFTLPFDKGGTAEQISGTKHCSGSTCGKPPPCSNDTSGNPDGTSCDSSYGASGRIEAFPSGF